MRGLISIFLSLVILVFSTGFTISSHYCGGKKVKSGYAFGIADVTCGMENDNNDCGEESIESDCCKDQHQYIHLDDDYSKVRVIKKTENNVLLARIISSFRYDSILHYIEFYNDYSPPPLIKDFSTVLQVFRI